MGEPHVEEGQPAPLSPPPPPPHSVAERADRYSQDFIQALCTMSTITRAGWTEVFFTWIILIVFLQLVIRPLITIVSLLPSAIFSADWLSQGSSAAFSRSNAASLSQGSSAAFSRSNPASPSAGKLPFSYKADLDITVPPRSHQTLGILVCKVTLTDVLSC